MLVGEYADGAVKSVNFSHQMFENGAGSENEEDSAKTVFMAVGALGAAFAALAI